MGIKMNIIKRIASRGLKAERLKNVFVIFTIILATCMMMVVGLYFVGDIQRRENEIANRYQASFININLKKIQKLKNIQGVEKVGVSKEVGVIDAGTHKLSLIYMDDVQIELNQFKGLKGRMPKEKNEIIILEDYAKFTKKSIDIGDSVKLDESENGKAFIVSGILPVKSDGRNFMVIVSRKYLSNMTEAADTYSAYLKLSNTQELTGDELREKIDAIGEDIGCDKKNIVYSSYYFAMKDMDTKSQQGIIIGVYTVIILACAIVIYSIFYVSVISKLNEYGRLRTIGADKKQVRAIIRKEANILSFMGIPTGVFIGGVLSYFIMPDTFNINKVILYAVIVSSIVYVMIKFSTSKPGKLAAAVPPIMALKQIGFEGERGKKVSKKLHRHLTPFNLAYISVMRNKKKTILTVCSLGFCGVLLMASASYLKSVNPIEMARATEYPYGDFKIRFSGGTMGYKTDTLHEIQEKNNFDKELLKALSSLDGVEGVRTYYGSMVNLELKGGITEPSSIDALNKQEFEKMKPYLKNGDINYEKFSNEKGIIVVGRDWNTIYGFDFEIGDVINATNYAGLEEKFKIMDILDSSYLYGGEDVFFASEDKLDFISSNAENTIYQIEVKANSSNVTDVENSIRNLIQSKPELELITLEESAASFKASLDNQIAPIYMLVLFIAVFGVVNMMNTLFTNVITRKRELSIYQTIGLSNKQLRKMLIYEGIIYFIGIGMITIIFGTFAGVVLCNNFNKISSFGKVVYNFPGTQMSLYLFVILATIALCSIISIIYYQRETLVERMRSVS